MTENLPMEYVSITEDDIVEVLNGINNTAVYATEYPRNERRRNSLHQFYIKGLYFIWINGNIYTARTSYGKKKLYFELIDGEVVNFEELDIIEESNFIGVLNLHTVKHLMVGDEIFYWLERNSRIVNNGVDNSLIIDIKWILSIPSIYEKFGYSRNSSQRLTMNMEVRDSFIHSISIDSDENVMTYADITRARSLASEYMNNYSDPRFISTNSSIPEGNFVSYYGENIGILENMEINGYGVNSTIKPNTFSYSKKDKEIRDFIDGPGMFKIGVKKFKVLPIEEQWEKVKKLDYIIIRDDTYSIKKNKDFEFGFDLKTKGIYNIELESSPIARRLDTKETWYNPFICRLNNSICLGNMKSTYENCYNNGNYLECVKIIKEVLTCEDDSNCYSGQKWRELKKKIKDDNNNR